MVAAPKLYGTEFCHLCDQAEAILHDAGVAFEYVDIAGDDGLVELYGTRIPVLKRMEPMLKLAAHSMPVSSGSF